jgi:hypothetical protein
LGTWGNGACGATTQPPLLLPLDPALVADPVLPLFDASPVEPLLPDEEEEPVEPASPVEPEEVVEVVEEAVVPPLLEPELVPTGPT